MIIKPVGREGEDGEPTHADHWAVQIKEVFAWGRVGFEVYDCLQAHIAIDIIKCFPLRFQ